VTPKLGEEQIEANVGPGAILPGFDELANGRSWFDDHAAVVWRARKLLSRIFFFTFVLALGVAFLLPKEYRSTVTLAPPDNPSGSRLAAMLQMIGSDSGLTSDLLGQKNTGDLLVEMLRSRILRGRIVEKYGLQRVYHSTLLSDARDALSQHTIISQDKKSGVIIITVLDSDSGRAKVIADAYVNELNQLSSESNTSAARRERIFIEGRLASVKDELTVAEKDFSEFASKNVAIDVPQQGKAMVEAAATLQGQLIAAQAELSGLEQIYSQSNVRVRALRAKIVDLQTRLNQLGGVADAKSAADEGSIYPSIKQLPILGVTYADLYRKVKVQEAVFETLTKQYELAKIEEVKELPSIRVLDPPEVAQRKSWPPRLAIAIFIAFAALILSITGIIFHVWWQRLDPSDKTKIASRMIVERMRELWRQSRHNTDPGQRAPRIVPRV